MTDPGTLADRARAVLEASPTGLTAADLSAALFGAASVRLAAVVDRAGALLDRLVSRGDATVAADGRWFATVRLPSPTTGPAPDVPGHASAPTELASGSASALDWARSSVEVQPVGPVSALAVLLAGSRGGRLRLVEAAVVRIEAGTIAMTWSSLANPDPGVTGHVRLPMTVLERAGLEPEAFEGAPPVTAVLEEMAGLIAGTTVIGHDVATVLDALGVLARWHGVAPPYRRGMTVIDTEALARAVLPGLIRPSLDRVASALGVPPVRRDRAPERARQVAGIWLALCARQAERGDAATHSLAPALPGGHVDAAPTLGWRVATGAISATAPGAFLPEGPGVYRFHDAAGAVLYVGKAANLRARVAQHFAGTGATARGDALLTRAAAVSHEATACELDAAILEQSMIGETRPPYNVQATARHGPPYLVLDATGPFPRIGGTRDPSTHPAEATFGPYRTSADARKAARTVVRAFGIRPCTRTLPARSARLRVPCLLYGQGTCPAPCAPHVTPEEYARAVDLGRAWLAGGRDAALVAIDAGLRAMPADAGAVAWLEETRRKVVRLRVDVRPLADVPRGAWLLLACRAEARSGPDDPSVVTFLTRDGRLVARREWRVVEGSWVGGAPAPVAPDAARDAIIARRTQRSRARPHVMMARTAPPGDEAIARWLDALAVDPGAFDVDDGDPSALLPP